MNNRFKFRCWVNDEFPKMVHNYFDEYTECVSSVDECQYYIYSDMVSGCEIVTTPDDVEKACGLNEEDFESYYNYLYYMGYINSYDYVFLNGTLEQCTGGKDRNGKLIYEGDILEGGGCRYVVKWDEFMHGFYGCADDETCFTLGKFLIKNSVIIGNIHENPELLSD